MRAPRWLRLSLAPVPHEEEHGEAEGRGPRRGPRGRDRRRRGVARHEPEDEAAASPRRPRRHTSSLCVPRRGGPSRRRQRPPWREARAQSGLGRGRRRRSASRRRSVGWRRHVSDELHAVARTVVLHRLDRSAAVCMLQRGRASALGRRSAARPRYRWSIQGRRAAPGDDAPRHRIFGDDGGRPAPCTLRRAGRDVVPDARASDAFIHDFGLLHGVRVAPRDADCARYSLVRDDGGSPRPSGYAAVGGRRGGKALQLGALREARGTGRPSRAARRRRPPTRARSPTRAASSRRPPRSRTTRAARCCWRSSSSTACRPP